MDNGDDSGEKQFKPLELPDEDTELKTSSTHESFFTLIRNKIGNELTTRAKKRKQDVKKRRKAKK